MIGFFEGLTTGEIFIKIVYLYGFLLSLAGAFLVLYLHLKEMKKVIEARKND